ncbi:MAG: GTPase HflX [Mariprofundaceae bacterium]|nr:GTPase HflX [Mariprofundaceae bacterium]
MPELTSTERMKDRALSVHPQIESRHDYISISRQEEFDRLALASDCDLRDSISIPVRRMTASTLLGSGQVEMVGEQVKIHEADVVFVDHQLTPVQQRNLEKSWECKVVDRTGLILEIFAARARTREGVLQVELASLNYQISRLVRSWTHLERQRGGFGFMGGPGERQIELDRRMIRTRIKSLEKDLAHVRRMRATQRSGRQRKEIATVALVGYTNAGKSTLFNQLTEATVYVADKLFATLDPTLRLLELPGGRRVMLSDTVGFVQDLPHELVDAFKSTLEEVTEADLILHVRDASDPGSADQKLVVEETLAELGLDGDDAPPVVELLNKIDLVPQTRSKITPEISGSRVAISALTGEGTDTLLELLSKWCEQDSEEFTLQIPVSDGKTLAYCHAHGRVLAQKVKGDQLMLTVRMASRYASKVR